MRKPKLVVFDVDGLMLDTEAIWQKAWTIAGKKYGYDDLGHTVFMKCVGRNGKEVEDTIMEELSELPQPLAVLDDARTEAGKILEGHIDVKPGLWELLDYLDGARMRKAVATVTPRNQTEERLSRLGLWDRFDYILCGDEVRKRKPDPEIYLTVIKKFGVSPEDALVLEDSVSGVQAAHNAHIPCIMVPDLKKPEELQMRQTIAIAESLRDVIVLLEE